MPQRLKFATRARASGKLNAQNGIESGGVYEALERARAHAKVDERLLPSSIERQVK